MVTGFDIRLGVGLVRWARLCQLGGGGHDCESKGCFDRSDDRKASLQEAMRKWAEQASMREDKAVDIARKSKAKRQREGGDAHRAWLDRK